MSPDRAPKTRRSPAWLRRRPWRAVRQAAWSWPTRWKGARSHRLTVTTDQLPAVDPPGAPGRPGRPGRPAAALDALDGAVGADRPTEDCPETVQLDESEAQSSVEEPIEEHPGGGATDGAVAEPAAPPAGDGPPEQTGTLADLLPVVIGAGGQDDRTPIPWKTIWATIGIVLAAAALIELVLALKLVIGLVVIATFLAIVLTPPVTLLTRLGVRRGMATGLVFVVGLAAIGGLGYVFIHPLYREATRLGNQVPDLLAKTQAGKGPLGNLISRYHLQKTAATEIPKLRQWLGKLGGPALSLARRVIAGIGGIITIGILTFLILLEGPTIVAVVLRSLPAPQSRRLALIMRDVARSVTGYVVGNTATSVIAGIICGVTLAILGVPFAVVFAVWVAMVDYLPLIGGLLAGVPTVAFALLHSPTAGIITAIVFLVYQQVENHILNPLIMSRTVKLNPLWVILSVLAGAQLASIVGALLAIPVAGAIQVVARDLWQERRKRDVADPDGDGRAAPG